MASPFLCMRAAVLNKHSWDNTPTPEQTPGRKMEEGTKRLRLEVSSSTASRRQNILEITSPKPLIAQSRTQVAKCVSDSTSVIGRQSFHDTTSLGRCTPYGLGAVLRICPR